MYLFIYTELGRYMNLTYTLLLELFYMHEQLIQVISDNNNNINK